MTYLTWDGMRLFQKPETAATYALDNRLDPYKVKLLENGKLVTPPAWEVRDLLMHMRDQAPPC